MSVWKKRDAKTLDDRTFVPIGKKLGGGNTLPTLKNLTELKDAFHGAVAITEEKVTSANVKELFLHASELKGYNDKLKLFVKGQQQVRRNALGVLNTALQGYTAVYRDTAMMKQSVNRFGQQVAPQMLGIDANRADHKGYREYWDAELNNLIDW